MTRCVFVGVGVEATDKRSWQTRHPAAIMRLLYYPGLEEEYVYELMLGTGAGQPQQC